MHLNYTYLCNVQSLNLYYLYYNNSVSAILKKEIIQNVIQNR